MNANINKLLLFSLIVLLLAACGQAEVDNTNLPADGDTAVVEEAPPLLEGDQNDATQSVTEADDSLLESVSDDEPLVVEAEDEAPVADPSVEHDANGVQVGFTAEGYPYRGNPEAAVVIEEYSDFQ